MEGRRLDFDCKKRKGSKSMHCAVVSYIHLLIFMISSFFIVDLLSMFVQFRQKKSEQQKINLKVPKQFVIMQCYL